MYIWRKLGVCLEYFNNLNNVRYLSNKSAWICKMKRPKYLRSYPTLLVLHNGATYTIRHNEPRKIIKLPLDISTVSEEEKLIILQNRKPKKKVVIEEELEDTFDSNKYLRILHKKKAVGNA